MSAAPLANQAAPVFTVARIAAAWKMKRQAVQHYLKGVAPAGKLAARGLQASAWTYEQFPTALREKGDCIAKAKGQSSGQTLLVCAPQIWKPAIPLPELHADCIEQAVKLQRALGPPLDRKSDSTLNQQDRAQAGIKDYARHFGHAITERHWWNLYDRTITRDAGAGNWARLEIYLPNQLKRKTEARIALPASDKDFTELHELVTSFKNPAAPTLIEKSATWEKAFRIFEIKKAAGEQSKKLRLSLIAFLWRACPALAKSENALRVAFDARLARETQTDGRTLKRGVPKAPKYSQDQVDMVKYFSAKYTGGRSSQAARELNEAGLITDPRLKQALDKATSKSYLPASFRDNLKDVPAHQVISLGPKSARKLTPPRELTYGGIFSMDCLVGDDETANCYVGVWSEELNRRVPIRPQLIPVIDFRSSRVLSRAVVPRPQYTALDVRSSFKQAMMKYGLPKFILREGGIWRKGALVNSLALIGTGATATEIPYSPAEAEYLLREKKGIRLCSTVDDLLASMGETGIRFRESFQPRSKPVEGVIRLLQTRTDKLPCRTGRDERIDCPEETKAAVEAVRTGKADPHEVGMLYFEEFIEEYHAVCDRYNNERQEGRKLCHPLTGAPLSPNEAYVLFQNTNDPPSPWDAQIDAILSSIKLECMVKSPRMRRRSFPCGFVEIRGNTYCGEETGKRTGEKLIAYYDPEFPESCTFEDTHTTERFTVPRLEPTNALYTDEQTKKSAAQAHRTISVLKSDYRAMEAKFEPLLRKTILSRASVQLNQDIELGKGELQGRQEVERRNIQRSHRLAAGTGVVQPARAIGRTDPNAGRELRDFLKGGKSEPKKPAAPVEPKIYVVKSSATKTPQRQYVDYLLNRLTEFRKIGQKSYCQSYSGPVSIHTVISIARRELKCDLYAPENFEKVCDCLKEKINATRQGQKNAGMGHPNYHPFHQEVTI
jgi:hypothetical protein